MTVFFASKITNIVKNQGWSVARAHLSQFAVEMLAGWKVITAIRANFVHYWNVFSLHGILLCTSEAESNTLWWTTDRHGETIIALELQLLPAFSACINTAHFQHKRNIFVYKYPCWNYCKERSSGVELLLACLTVSVFNQISERERGSGRQLGLGSFSGPFLETPPSYSPLENSELLREEEENWLLGRMKQRSVV